MLLKKTTANGAWLSTSLAIILTTPTVLRYNFSEPSSPFTCDVGPPQTPTSESNELASNSNDNRWRDGSYNGSYGIHRSKSLVKGLWRNGGCGIVS